MSYLRLEINPKELVTILGEARVTQKLKEEGFDLSKDIDQVTLLNGNFLYTQRIKGTRYKEGCKWV